MKRAIADIIAERSLSFALRRVMGMLGFCVAWMRDRFRAPSCAVPSRGAFLADRLHDRFRF
jgi:hypothetical protein